MALESLAAELKLMILAYLSLQDCWSMHKVSSEWRILVNKFWSFKDNLSSQLKASFDDLICEATLYAAYMIDVTAIYKEDWHAYRVVEFPDLHGELDALDIKVPTTRPSWVGDLSGQVRICRSAEYVPLALRRSTCVTVLMYKGYENIAKWHLDKLKRKPDIDKIAFVKSVLQACLDHEGQWYSVLLHHEVDLYDHDHRCSCNKPEFESKCVLKDVMLEYRKWWIDSMPAGIRQLFPHHTIHAVGKESRLYTKVKVESSSTGRTT